MTENYLDQLKGLFVNEPYLLKIVTLSSCESEITLDFIRKGESYAKPVNLYMTGRVGTGKTSIGNLLLANQAMKSTGYMDCTDYLGILDINNLVWFDTPGAGSDEEYENITRSIFLMPPLKGKSEARDFTVKTFSTTGEILSSKNVLVSDWRSCQEKLAPDVIVVMVAPHMQITKDDISYIKELIATRKSLNPDNQIIFVLNQFYKSIEKGEKGEKGEKQERVLITTPQNNEDCRNRIKTAYKTFYPHDEAPIVELDALGGKGIEELTRLMCRFLPTEKLGKMESVLKDELKDRAREERNRRYRENVVEIAARIALKKVDYQVGQKDIVKLATMAVLSYGILTYENTTVKTEEIQKLEGLAKDATDQKTASILTQEVKTKEEDNIVFETKVRWEEWDDEVTVPIKGKSWTLSIPPLITYSEEGGTRVETHTVHKKQPIGETVSRKDGTRLVVDQVLTKEVGKNYFKGGYEVIKLLLSTALGCETREASNNSQGAFVRAIEEAEQKVESKLQPVKSQIEQLVESNDEKQLIELIKSRLI